MQILLTLVLFFSLAVSSQAASWSDFWCRTIGLGCPPPAQSDATNPDFTGTSVPLAFPPNGNSLARYDQAFHLREYLNAHLAAKILPGDDSTQPGQLGAMGIYIPGFYGIDAPVTYWRNVKYYYLHYRFDNGAEINVGLAIAKFQSFPTNPRYVLGQIAADAKTTSLLFAGQ